MRIIISLVVIFLSLAIHAEEFTVFEKDGFYGIRNNEGEVTVPAVYERLGWSNGETGIHNGVIGFREGKLWGLITVKNKSLTAQKFYTIEPLIDGYVKASVKGKFSNQLFHGVLNEQGKTVVSFHYFTLEVVDQHLKVSEYDPGGLLYGLVSLDNVKLIPLRYSSISKEQGIYHAMLKDQTIDLYLKTGTLLESAIDSIEFRSGWKCFRDGYAGFIDEKGEIKYTFEYKNFQLSDNIIYPIAFPTWDIYENDDLILSLRADSLKMSEKGFWITYLNGSHHFALSDTMSIEHNFLIKDLDKDYVILENAKSRYWSIKDYQGNTFIDEADSIMRYPLGFWVLQDQYWRIYNESMKKISKQTYKKFRAGLEGQFITKSGDYWGLVGNVGQTIARSKYDQIQLTNEAYKIQYLNRWGVMNEQGEWEIRPEFDEVFSFNHLRVGRRGQGYTFFRKGVEILKTTWRPVKQIGEFVLVQDSEGMAGLINESGEVFVYPEFNQINRVENHITLKTDSTIELMTYEGNTVIDDKSLQDIAGFGEDYFLIMKNDRWGYVDTQGRLRISNRYEDARTFSQGFAAIRLRGKWGFINKSEELIVQPYYDEVGNFHNNRCIVKSNGMQGLIDEEGAEVLAIKWSEIKRLNTGNYIVKDGLGKVGIINSKGEFLLRPAFDSLEDFGNHVIFLV
ncbi:MAG: WG repeat-containing protein [Bacteroidota bacterium]